TYARAIGASRAARDAAERNVEAERKRFENGLSTNFQVLQVQQQLSDARRSELQATVGYNAAVSAFHRAVGDILEVRSIAVEQEEPKEPRMFSRFDRYPWMNYGSHVEGERK
ncbi:MAG: TolC family protein, partial [Thermoanaerobaculia bacterium]